MQGCGSLFSLGAMKWSVQIYNVAKCDDTSCDAYMFLHPDFIEMKCVYIVRVAMLFMFPDFH